MNELIQQAMGFASQHWSVFVLAIIVIAWIWEDAAVFFAAIASLEGEISLPLALIASLVGITSGDFALYLLGRYGRRWRWLRGWLLGSAKGRMLRKKFHNRTLSNIFLIRFVPGLRTLGFTFCGLWRVPLLRFSLAMVGAGVVWIAVVFLLVNLVGMSDTVRDSNWKWALMGFALLLLVINNVRASRMTITVKPN
ncbi:DedA family protein [Teredinibacter purpureus]|uniref:DedA family protein n=1 Tax=Teredinibacter purpureus TaxID=2731756 RepID=UPI0006978307|nr:VTT domain-containing protein [Teredinibacter purpureus]